MSRGAAIILALGALVDFALGYIRGYLDGRIDGRLHRERQRAQR